MRLFLLARLVHSLDHALAPVASSFTVAAAAAAAVAAPEVASTIASVTVTLYSVSVV